MNNLDQLANTCFFTYEELTERPDDTIRRITDFLPELGVLDIESKFTAHNITGQAINGLINLNPQKIEQLTGQQVDEINMVLGRHEDILANFQYSLINKD